MYQKYTTLGFIIHSFGSGEGDKMYYLYTKDFGMVHAHATSVRMSKSKLRPHLNIGVPIFFTLLKSKNRWKMTEATESGARLSNRSAQYKIFIRVLLVLKSLIHGEEKNESLFESLQKFYEVLTEQKDDKNLSGIEMIAMLSLLSSLGYGVESAISKYGNGEYNQNVIDEAIQDKKEIIKAINKSLKETGF